MPMRCQIEIRHQKNIRSKLDNDCASSYRKSVAKRHERQIIIDDSVTISAVRFLLEPSHPSPCGMNVHL